MCGRAGAVLGNSSASLSRQADRLQMCLQLGEPGGAGTSWKADLGAGPHLVLVLFTECCDCARQCCCSDSPAPLARSVRRGGAAEGRHGRERLPDGVLDRALLLLPLGHADLTPLPPRRSPSAMQAPHSCPDFFLLL